MGFIGVWLNLVSHTHMYTHRSCFCDKHCVQMAMYSWLFFIHAQRHPYIPYNWFDSDDSELGVSFEPAII